MLLINTNGVEIAPYPLRDLRLDQGEVAGLKLLHRGPGFGDFAAATLKALDERMAGIEPDAREYCRTRLAYLLNRKLQKRLPSIPVVIRVEEASRAVRFLMLRRLARGGLVALVRDEFGRIVEADSRGWIAAGQVFLKTALTFVREHHRSPHAYFLNEPAPMCLLGRGPDPGRWLRQKLAPLDHLLGTDPLPIIAETLLEPYARECEEHLACFAGVPADVLRHVLRTRPKGSASAVALFRGATTEQAIKYREQAFQVFPVIEECIQQEGLAPVLHSTVRVNRFGTVDVGAKRAMPAFFRAVDAGLPVIDAMVEEAQLPRWAINAALRMPPVALRMFSDFDRAAHVVAMLTPDRVPRTKDDWFALAQAYNQPDFSRGLFSTLLRQDYDGLRKALGFMADARLDEYRTWLEDMLRMYLKQRPIELTDWLGTPSFGEWVKLARAWQRAERRAEQCFGPRLERWPALFEPVSHAGLELVCLTTLAELAAEAVKMDNCLAGYGGLCVTGSAHIVSVRERGQSIATMQLSAPQEAWPLVTLELFAGVGDVDVPKSLEKDLRSFVTRIEAGEVALNPEVRTFAYAKQVFQRDSAELFRAVAREKGEAGMELYRRALEIAPGRGKLWPAIRAAAIAKARQPPDPSGGLAEYIREIVMAENP